MELNELTAHELIEKIKKREITPPQIINSLKKRVEKTEPQIRAYVRLTDANFSGRFSAQHPPQAPLEGIPVSIKDNICTQAINTECCSRILQGFKPPYSATVIERLEKSGAGILEIKNNMDEFAFGSSTENSCFGPTHNPWDLERVVGGSSGGGAAAVACDAAIVALGSDTGGSIRQPASFCGVVGLKPSYGRVSRFGLIAYACSLDQIGPITKDVKDAALILKEIAGFDPRDSTSLDRPVADYTQSLINDVNGVNIGVPQEYFVEGVDTEVKAAVLAAIDRLKQLGARVHQISLPHAEYAVPAYYLISTAEASSNLAKFDGIQYGLRRQDNGRDRENKLINMYTATRGEGFGQEAKRRIILGTYALSYGHYEAYYLRAQKVRTLLAQDFKDAFKAVDCIITPTCPTAAFKIGERIKDPLQMYLSDSFTISANLAGIPAISLPCGFTRAGLPVGLQIMAEHFNEELLFRVAYTYEQNTDWHSRKPML